MGEDALWDILLDAGLTEQQIEEIMQLGALEGERGLAQTQYEQAQALRRTPGPRGQWTGRIYRHAHPLEFLSAGVDRTMGAIEAEKQMRRQEQILTDQGRLRAAFLGHLLQQRQNPPAAPATPPMGAMSPVQPGMGNPAAEALRNIAPRRVPMR